MSDNIPFKIQIEIIKKVYDVKSLIQFRSVSKPWKSFIDSSDFIKGYDARHTQPQSFILSYISDLENEAKHYRLVDDDNNETFKVQEFAPSVLSHLLKHYCVQRVVGACHGLMCFYGYNKHNYTTKVVIWNPSIGKPFGIALPIYDPILTLYGFGVCPFTSDPTVVKFVCKDNMPWHVEVFTLSSGVWNIIPSGECCSVWVMEHDSSFRKLFKIRAPLYKILGFRMNGEPIFELEEADEQFTTLNVYEPRSQQIKQIKNLGISVVGNSFFMGSYKESLLLLDHSDLHIYSDDS
ncbi:probable LRR receptor-like serine/threonine-protein kinase isoform X2 [Tanacetum coccineum]